MNEWAAEELRAVCLQVSVAIVKGEPQRLRIEEAQKWDADSIFVGSRGLDHPDEKAGLGGVSTGLATNAPCTVEQRSFRWLPLWRIWRSEEGGRRN